MSGATFPLSAVVGHDDLRLALMANAVSPAIGGVLVRGEKGTAKSTAVRALARLLPEVEVVAGCLYSCDPAAPDPACPSGPHPPGTPSERRPVRLVELPVGASTDRLAGALDIERALVDGVRAFEPGLLAAAHRGILYVDEVNLLADHLVDLLLDAAALGVNYVERDGVSVRHPARFLLVGTMNPEEGELRPQLLDRFGLSVDVRGTRDPSERAQIVRRRLAFDAEPDAFARRFAGDDAALGERIGRARSLLPAVDCSDRVIRRIAGACAKLEVDGLRADIVTARAATALAALEERREVGDEDVRRAALLALHHRRRRGPLEQPGIDEGELDRALEGAGETAAAGAEDPEPDGDDSGPDGDGPGPRGQSVGSDDDGSGSDRNGSEAGADRSGGGPHGRTMAAGGSDRDVPESPEQARHTDSPGAATRTDSPAGSFHAPLVRLEAGGAGRPGRRSSTMGGESGRAVGERPYAGGGSELALLPTLRAAAPHQRARGRTGAGLKLAASDLRSPLREGREGNLVVFAVDASGSMAARRRMSAVKGAVLALLVDAYQRRDRIGLVSFRGSGAETLLPPTSSVEVAASRLAELPTGGRTPLAAGLEHVRRLLALERVRDPDRRPLVFLVTDGRANIAGEGARVPAGAPGGTAGQNAPATAGRSARAAAGRAAQALVAGGAGLVVVDSEEGPVRLGLAGSLAGLVGAPLLPLGELGGEGLAAGVREIRGRAA